MVYMGIYSKDKLWTDFVKYGVKKYADGKALRKRS